jgi:hypothetical protein
MAQSRIRSGLIKTASFASAEHHRMVAASPRITIAGPKPVHRRRRLAALHQSVNEVAGTGYVPRDRRHRRSPPSTERSPPGCRSRRLSY